MAQCFRVAALKNSNITIQPHSTPLWHDNTAGVSWLLSKGFIRWRAILGICQNCSPWLIRMARKFLSTKRTPCSHAASMGAVQPRDLESGTIFRSFTGHFQKHLVRWVDLLQDQRKRCDTCVSTPILTSIRAL